MNRSSRLRVLAVCHNYPRRSAPGAGLFSHALHLGLRDHGIDVEVLQLADWAPPWPASALLPAWRANRAHRRDLLPALDGITFHHPETVEPRPSRLFPGDVWQRQVRALVRYCAARPALRGVDAVIGHFMVPDGYHALGLARALGVPALSMAWGDDVHAWPAQHSTWRDRLRVVLSGVDVPIACSEQLATDANEWLDSPRDDWEVVYAGVQLDRFRPAVSSAVHRNEAFPAHPELAAPDARVLLMLAQPVLAKGYLDVLDAWAATAPGAPGWHLVMAGGNWGNVDVEREIASRGLGGRAHWLGALAPEAIPELLRASDAFVLPSHGEGLSISVLEAMATGLATVATDVGGHAEVIRDGREGWLVPPRDSAALAAALADVTARPDERVRRGRLARAAAERVGTPSDNAARLASVIRRAVGAHAGDAESSTAAARARG
ncbi:MAG: glycosyltransferase [Gemmatimonadaceae bacterium]